MLLAQMGVVLSVSRGRQIGKDVGKLAGGALRRLRSRCAAIRSRCGADEGPPFAPYSEKSGQKEEEALRVLMTGGGTAGHINPALAIADTIKEKNPDAEILFVGAKGRMETTAGARRRVSHQNGGRPRLPAAAESEEHRPERIGGRPCGNGGAAPASVFSRSSGRISPSAPAAMSAAPSCARRRPWGSRCWSTNPTPIPASR